MPNRLAALVAILAALAGPPAAAAAAEPASPWRALAAQRFEPVAQARLQANGYTVTPAQVVWYSTASARVAGRPQPAAFYVNNPLTTYGGIEIARKSSAAAGDVPDAFELDGDAAIALYGVTPPPISYYSFTMNEFARNHDDFFVISVARDCNGEPYCLEIPYESQPGAPGLGRSELVKLTTRIYLDPIMGTAPNPANFVPARLFWLQK